VISTALDSVLPVRRRNTTTEVNGILGIEWEYAGSVVIWEEAACLEALCPLSHCSFIKWGDGVGNAGSPTSWIAAYCELVDEFERRNERADWNKQTILTDFRLCIGTHHLVAVVVAPVCHVE
jgi:hypothetical protein